VKDQSMEVYKGEEITVSTLELRENLSQICEAIKHRAVKRIIITRNGKPYAVLVHPDDVNKEMNE